MAKIFNTVVDGDNAILTVNMYKAVDQDFIIEASAELNAIVNATTLDGKAVTTGIVQILTPIPAQLACIMCYHLGGVVSNLYFQTTQDQSGVVDGIKTTA